MELEVAIKHWKNNLDRWKKDRPDLSNTEIVEEIDQDYKAIETVLNHVSKQDKLIELMISKIDEYAEHDDEMCMQDNYYCDEDCKSCIKQYFEKKVEESE